MKLETNCQDCRQPITATLPDETPERDAQAIAGRLYCVPCAIRRVLLVTQADVNQNAASVKPDGKAK
jgi:hypothetical protein